MNKIRAAVAAFVVALLALIPLPANAATGTSLAGAPTTADGFFQAFQDKNDLTWSGGDQVTSFAHNGYVYWLFGDSMLSDGVDPDGSYPDGTQMVANRILLQQGDQFVNAIANAGSGDAGNGILDPPTHTDDNQLRFWTQGMFYANNHLYVLAQRVDKDPDPNSMGFKSTGVELAKFAIGADGKLTFKELIATPSTSVAGGAGPLHIQWSGDAIVSGGYVYFYGATMAKDNPYVIHYSYVARVPTGQVENPYAWRYYAKSSGTWKQYLRDLNQDLTNQPDAILAGQVSSVRWVPSISQHVMLHKPWNGWGSDVKALKSATPFGWNQSAEVTIFSSPAGTDEHGHAYQTYSPQIHTTQTLTSGKVLVSIAWNNNGGTLADLLADADLYKPRFHEIQF